MKKLVLLPAMALACVLPLWMQKSRAANDEAEIRQLLDRR